MYEALANITMVLHVAIMVFIIVGVGISILVKRFRPIEAGVLLAVIVIWSLYGGCPLTFFENYLRAHTSHPIPLAELGFIPYYTHAWFGFTVPDAVLETGAYLSALVLVGLMAWGKFKKK